jgi:hypothetical protein
MAKLTEEQQQWVVKDYNRRRLLLWLIWPPSLAAVYILIYLYQDSSHEISGLGAWGPAAVAAAVAVVGMLLHLNLWRCPMCATSIKPGQKFCRRCGALFIAQASAGKRRALLERDVRGEIGDARWEGWWNLVASGFLVLGGIAFAYLGMIGRGAEITPDRWQRTVGVTGAKVSVIAAGIVLTALGVWNLAGVRRRMAGLRAKEKALRQRAGLPTLEPAPPRPAAARATAESAAPVPPKPAPPAAAPSPAGQAAKQAAKPVTDKPAAKPAVKPAAPFVFKLSSVETWVVAAGANLCMTWGARWDSIALPQPAERCQKGLIEWWGVNGPAGVASTLDWLRREGHSAEYEAVLASVLAVPLARRDEVASRMHGHSRAAFEFVAAHHHEIKGGTLVAWDTVRLSFVARCSFTAGWLDDATAWQVALEAARKLQRSYSSWKEMSDNYQLGRGFWGEASAESVEEFRRNAEWLLTSRRSPWPHLPWDLPLDSLHPS